MELFNNSKKKFIAYALCLIIALFSSFSFYIVSEAAHHDCIGDNCKTCAYIDAVAEGLKQLGDGAIVDAETVLVTFNPQNTIGLNIFTAIILLTLVSIKVRLND